MAKKRKSKVVTTHKKSKLAVRAGKLIRGVKRNAFWIGVLCGMALMWLMK